jgi:hypothetical protein
VQRVCAEVRDARVIMSVCMRVCVIPGSANQCLKRVVPAQVNLAGREGWECVRACVRVDSSSLPTSAEELTAPVGGEGQVCVC